MDAKEAVIKFNDCINRKDIAGLSSLMADDYTFIDTANDVFFGKPRGIAIWSAFFRQFPDYRNVFGKFEVRGPTVLITGHSECSFRELEGPAIWTAVVRGGKVAEWRVYADTPENRKKLGL